MYLSFVTYASNPLLYNCKTYDISDFALESFKIKSDLLFSKTFFDESRSTLLRLRFGYRQYLHLSVSVNLIGCEIRPYEPIESKTNRLFSRSS